MAALTGSHARLSLGPSSPSFGTYVDVAVIGNLPHYVVNDELTFSIFVARNQAERLDHERTLLIRRDFAMLRQHRHRGVA